MSRELNIFQQAGKNPVNTNLDATTDSYNYQEWMRKKTLESVGKSHPSNTVSAFENSIDKRNAETSVAVDKFKNSIDKVAGEGEFIKAGNAAMTAIGEAPSIVNQLQQTPESSAEATGKVLSLASSGGKIGGDIGGIFGEKGRVIGQVAGTAIGFLGGVADNVGWRHELVKKKDEETIAKLGKSEEELLNNYIKNKTSTQLKLEQGIHARALGYSTRNS